MSGTSTSQFTASAIVPNHESWGHYQRFNFSNTDPLVKLQAFSQFVPTSANSSIINIESRNFNYAGFRWRHLTQSTDTNMFGSFTFQSFISDGVGIDIFGFNGTNFNIYFPTFLNNTLNMGTNKITSLAPGVSGTDAVNMNQLSSALSASTVVLTGNVTGSGVVGTSFPTTIVSTLDQIPVATSIVDLNSQKIKNSGSIGLGVSSFGTSDLQIQFSNAVTNRKICLYQDAANAFQFYGFGIQNGTLAYFVPVSTANHTFFAASSTTTAVEVGRITGTGDFISPGTLFGRLPGISAYLNGNTTTTPVASTVSTTTYRINGAHTSSTTANEFTLTATNPLRFTYSGTAVSPITVMVTAHMTFTYFVDAVTVRFFILKNGTIMPGGKAEVFMTQGAATAHVSLSLQTTMATNDFIDFAIGSTVVDTTGVKVSYGQFNIVAV